MNKTIAQISTPLATGGISIVKMSGKDSLNIAKKIFVFKNKNISEIMPRYLYLGSITYHNFTEQCLMVYFKAPYSYTGEDVVEFQCHGGELLTKEILNACLDNGATLAENGEFTKLGFMNGKISLDEAESMIDMINATSSAELKASSKIFKGELYKKITNLQDKLKDAIANLEVSIDYPEHDDEVKGIDYLKQVLLLCKDELEKLKATANDGAIIKSGVNVAIVGKPNVGKSSLLNALLNTERAIVTSVKGTTRDVLEETITHKGFKINFMDTAGIHNSNDEVEEIGITRAKECLKNADIVLLVFNSNEKLTAEDYEILELAKNNVSIKVINKSDLSKNITGIDGFEVSAKNKQNIDELKDLILNTAINHKIDFSGIIITNERHKLAISEALIKIDTLMSECNYQTIDILDMLTKEVWQILGKITGESENEDIISSIFSKFCLGK